ncbi:unnamed protein product, partial [Polarella glacialis]
LALLLDGKADVHCQDGQGRYLVHLWSWNLPKSRTSAKEELKKLSLLARHRADMNSQLPATGDTALHVLARIFNALSRRTGDEDRRIDSKDCEKFLNNTSIRIQMLADAGASVSIRNSVGQVPLELVEARFWPSLKALGGSAAAAAAAGYAAVSVQSAASCTS